MRDSLLQGQAVFTADDVSNVTHAINNPGSAPYVRGPYSAMYQHRPWTIRQYTGFGSAEASNAAFHRTLANGGQGLSVAFDLPTHLGMDSDQAEAQADVGRTGVAIDTVEDMKRLFKGIDLGQVSVSMTMNGAVLPVMAAYIVAAEEAGVDRQALRGTVQNDILKEFMTRNTYVFEPEPSLRITADVVEYLSEHVPGFHSQSISGYHVQEAGAEPALELALTLANANVYLDRIQSRGLDLSHFCHRLSFFFGVGMNFFEEIAKLRAARVMWHNSVSQRGGSGAACRMKMHCQTSGWSLSAQEPHNNLMRTTIEAMAAVFGGTQSLHTNGFDEALSIPTEASARLARNTQLILQQESGLCDVADPWGGSWMMESLTDRMIKRAEAWLSKIDQQGGVVAAIQSGWVQRVIHEQALAAQADIDTGRRGIIGVNCFTDSRAEPCVNEGEVEPDRAAIRTIDGERIQQDQAQRIAEVRHLRNNTDVAQRLEALTRGAADSGSNLLDLTIDAIRARATLGECTQALHSVWPRYQPGSQFSTAVYASGRERDTEWYRVRQRVRCIQQQQGRGPAILLVKLGLDGHDRGIKLVAAGLADLGFKVTLGDLLSSPEDVARHLLQHPYDALGVSLLSGAHLPLMRALVQTLNEQHRNQRSLSGAARVPLFVGGTIPEQDVAELRRLGVAQVFSAGAKIESVGNTVLDNLRVEGMNKVADRVIAP